MTKLLTIDLPGYEGLYEAHSTGHIWSVARRAKSGKGDKLKTYGNKYLRHSISPSGYPTVTLCRDGIRKCYTVHSLIAAAFLGNRPENCVINHKDGNKKNNTPSNLEYCTQLENRNHARRTGLMRENMLGLNNPNYKHGRYCQ